MKLLEHWGAVAIPYQGKSPEHTNTRRVTLTHFKHVQPWLNPERQFKNRRLILTCAWAGKSNTGKTTQTVQRSFLQQFLNNLFTK